MKYYKYLRKFSHFIIILNKKTLSRRKLKMENIMESYGEVEEGNSEIE